MVQLWDRQRGKGGGSASSMRNLLLIIAVMLLVFSIRISFSDHKVQTGQGCYTGDISQFDQAKNDTTERVHWYWQWSEHRDASQAFVACVGPRQYAVYRPLDIAGAGILLAAGLAFTAIKRKP